MSGDRVTKTIWIISKYASLPGFGPGPRLFFLGREFVRLGHDVTLFTSDANHLCSYPPSSQRYKLLSKDGVRICLVKTKKYQKTASLGRVLSWLDFERKLWRMPRGNFPPPDVVLVSSLSLFSIVYGYYLKKIYHSFLVFEVRDIWPLTMMEHGKFSQFHPLVVLMELVERFGYRNADLIVGTMPRLDEHVRRSIGYDRPFFCSPLGYDPEWEKKAVPLSESYVREFFPVGKFIVGYAGSMGVSNALEPLIRCIELLKERTDIHFVLVGAGDLRQQYISRLAGCANVSFGPKLTWTEILSFLRHCDLLFLSTNNSRVWDYGQSMNKLVEYMLSGRPIVASYSGYPSMLNESGAGVFVPAGDAEALAATIIKFAEMPREVLLSMGQKGRDWILKNRSYEKLGREYLLAIDRAREVGVETVGGKLPREAWK